ncbi:hypothetical protein CROQUDRAFT_36892, partial [Cronartium quercuum f. sp. fusiforme G11]
NTFASNHMFTFNHFYNIPHIDNDAKGWAFGIMMAMDLCTQGLAQVGQGFDVMGGDFVWTLLKTYFKFVGFDGYIKLMWQSIWAHLFTMPSHCFFPEK